MTQGLRSSKVLPRSFQTQTCRQDLSQVRHQDLSQVRTAKLPHKSPTKPTPTAKSQGSQTKTTAKAPTKLSSTPTAKSPDLQPPRCGQL